MSLRILFIIDGLGPGGAERSLVELLPNLRRANMSVTVACCYRRQPSFEGLLRVQGVDLRFLSNRGVIDRVREARRIIRTERPDVIHTALFESNIVGRFASIGQKRVVMTSLVGTPYDPIRLQNRDISLPKLWAVRAFDAWTARHLTTHFHAVTEAVKWAAVESLGISPKAITVIERGRERNRLGEPTAERRQQARLKFGLKDSDEVIVNVGRQTYEKGQRYLLEAMEEVTRSRPGALLLVAGPRGRQSDILEWIRQRTGLNERVRLLGHREDIPDLLASADLFVLPSLYEGAAGALLEAMALGLPIVASRIPATEEVLEEGKNALLVERAAVPPLAKAITNLLTDRERARAFGCRSREIFEKRFTLDRSTARMVELYCRLTGHADTLMMPQATSELRCG